MPLSSTSKPSRARLLGPLAAGTGILALSLFLMWFYYQAVNTGISALVHTALGYGVVQSFGLRILLREVLPVYLVTGLVLWIATALWGAVGLGKDWLHAWTFKESFWLTAAGMVWIHVALWWQVPTTLWMIRGIRLLPFWAAFLVLGGMVLVPCGLWLHRKAGARALLVVIPGWLILWTTLAQVPLWTGHRRPPEAREGRPVGALLIGVDSLRPDVAEAEGLNGFTGDHFPNAYSPLPATRLCYSLIWGGDPARYSVAHAIPSIEEFQGGLDYSLLDKMKAKGLKARLYMDDGGTIGLAGRGAIMDEITMPAAGWENFVNSNVAVHLPLYASWLDTVRIFPTTNPWGDLDSGLLDVVERGRGADLIFFHSCLLHQPIFLTRKELAEIPKWWAVTPLKMRPFVTYKIIDPKEAPSFDSREDPFLAYRIRVRSLLAAWKPIWNRLAKDPDYEHAARVIFADHGERFYHVSDTIRLQGIHGYDLDPWELRVPFVLAGPGTDGVKPTDKAVSVLELRDALAKRFLEGQPITAQSFGTRPFAPMRYHTVNTELLRPNPEGSKYRDIADTKIAAGTAIFPDGVWSMRYSATLEERSKNVSVARAEGDHLWVYHPLVEGGCDLFEYRGYDLVGFNTLDEAAFLAAKKQVDSEFLRMPPELAGK